MKKLAITAKRLMSAMTIAACFTLCYSCGGSSDSNSKGNEKQAKAAAGAGTPTSLNIRFIDGDSVTAKYNLAKDIQEQYIRSLSKLESAQQSKAAELQKFASQIEDKMRNNKYTTEQEYNADMAKLNKMQTDAQNYLGNMERNAAQVNQQQQQELLDSIQAFIQDYNAEKGYDAILFKAAGVYFNPALDITDEVVAGLNARYNKVSK